MYATLNLTLGCNLRCTYCYAGTKVNKTMTHDTAVESLDFLVARARESDGFLNITFFGGEPLLKFDLIKLVVAKAAEVEDVKIKFSMVTNGTLLTDEIIDYFQEQDILYTLSFDGDRTTQDLGRPTVDGKGSFDMVMKHVPKILAANPYIRVNVVVTPQTAFNLATSVRFLHETGFRYLEIQPDFSGMWDRQSFKVLTKQYKQIAEYYVEVHRQGRKLYLDIMDDKIRGYALNKVRQQGTPSPCSAGESTISIAPSGEIYPCVGFVQDDDAEDREANSLGNIKTGVCCEKKTSFRSFAKSAPSECNGCAFFERCRNHCACANYQGTGDPGKPSAFLCEHERMLIPIADRAGAILWKERNPLFIDKIYNEAHPIMSYMEETLGVS